MSRELPIHNGRMTTDLDANGFKIKNLPPGSGFTQAQADWNQADATAPDFIKNKPTIPAAVTIDATLTQQGAAADAKAVGDALRGGFTEWEFSDVPSGRAIKNVWYATSTPYGARWAVSFYESFVTWMADQDSQDATELTFLQYVSEPSTMTASRHLITPTKTSQLTNDGDGTNAFVKTNDTRLSDARTPTAHTHAIADVTGLGAALAQKANASDLPYALVTPGEWEFSGSGYHQNDNYSVVIEESHELPGEEWIYHLYINGTDSDYALSDSPDNTRIYFVQNEITATRASLPGHLLDRAVNLVNPTVAATTEWTWADGETGTPVFSNGYWTVQNASFDTYDGPVAGSATDTEITFAKMDTKSFYYSYTDYDYDTGEQVFVFNVGGEGGEEVRAKSKWSDNYYENIVENVEYDGVKYALEYPTTESSTGNTYLGTGTVVEHVVSLVTTYGPTVTLTMPQAVPGRVRDLIARIDLSQAAGAPPVAFSGGSFEAVDGEMPELVKGVNLLSFTETAAGVFAVAYKEVKPLAQGGS